MNLLKLTFTFLIICVFSMSAFAQPELTMWRVSSFDHDHDSHENEDSFKDKYECGVHYYLTHSEENTELRMVIRNDGDQELLFQLPLQLEEGSSEVFQITQQPEKNNLAPGEEVNFILSYVAPAQYIDDQEGLLSIHSNDPFNNICGMSIESGAADPPALPKTCVCLKDQNGIIDTTSIEGLFIPWIPIGNNAIGIAQQPLPQNGIIIHPGACTPDDIPCPSDEEVTCKIVGNGLRSVLNETDEGIRFGFDFSDGYCPCGFDQAEPVCIDGPFNLIFINVIKDRQIDTRMAPPCPGESFMLDTTTMCQLMPQPAAREEVASRSAEDYTYEWEVFGFGEITETVDAKITVSDWRRGDFAILKIFDGSGCMNVRFYPFSNGLIIFGNVISVEQDPSGGCNESDTLTLCYGPSEFGPLLRDINNRGETIVWESDNVNLDFIEESRKQTGPNTHCIDITGWMDGDRISATDPNNQDGNGCDNSSTYFISRDRNLGSCGSIAAENLIPSSGIRLQDPCSCGDPLNYVLGGITYFHDTMVIEIQEDIVTPVTLTNPVNWFDDSGNLQVGFMDPVGMTNADGYIKVDFWHREDEVATVDYSIPGNFQTYTGTFESMSCSACPINIPTLGQWGIICLTFLSLIFGIVGIKKYQKSIELG